MTDLPNRRGPLAEGGSKKCRGPCGKTQPVDHFAKRADSADGLQHWCRTCKSDWRPTEAVEVSEKECRRCGLVKPIGKFHRNPQSRDGHHGTCVDCAPQVTVTITEKQCSRCKQVKPATQFGRHRLTSDGLNSQCKECSTAQSMEWAKANPEARKGASDKHYEANRAITIQRAKTSRLKTKYGLTPDQVEFLRQSQAERCAVCLTTEPGGKGDFHVDHEHSGLGRVRGLLCMACNLGLGALHDNPDVVDRAANYVRTPALPQPLPTLAWEPIDKAQRSWGYKLKHRFSVTPGEWLGMYEQQGHGCAICGRSENSDGRRLHVDHDHACCPTKDRSCGKCIRGLLCGQCNTALGYLNEDAARLDAASAYLRDGNSFWAQGLPTGWDGPSLRLPVTPHRGSGAP